MPPSRTLRKNARVLVICHKQLGDVALLEPALASIRAASGGPIDLLTRSGHAPLIELMEGVRMIHRAWFRRYDAIFCYDGLDKSSIHALLAFAPRKDLILRTPEDLRPLAARAFKVILAPGLGDRYVAEYNWDTTDVGVSTDFRPPKLNRPPDSWRPAGFDTRDYLLLNPTAGWKSKRWKTKAWQALLDRFEGPEKILITSGAQDWQLEHSRAIADHVGDRAIFLGGATRLEEFLWLVANARMVLGVDGAAAHLAAAFGGKSLTVFVRTSNANWHFPTERSLSIAVDPDASGDARQRDIDEALANAEALWRL